MNCCKMSAPADSLGRQREGPGNILREATAPMPQMRKKEKQTGDILKLYRNRLFLMCLFLLGLLTVFPYGAHLDQRAEQEILYSNIKMYLHTFAGTDNSLYSQLDAYGIVDIADSIEKDHGMAVYYPVFWIFHINRISPFTGNIIWHVYIYLWVFCGISALFGLLQNMFYNFKVSTLTTALFFFTPKIFAESHYNNKDMLLLSLTLCIFFFGWKLWRETSWKYVIAFSLTGSLAANMKVIGIWIWGIIGLYILCAMLCAHQFNRKMIIKTLACVSLAAFLYVLLTPACWTGPGEFIRYLIESARDFRWNDYVLFAGSMYNKNTTGIPRTYLPVMILLSVPVGILLLALIGLCRIVYSLFKAPSGFFDTTGYSCAAVLTGMIPLGYAVLSGTPVYNGWRHFYFCYSAIILMAAYGIFSLLSMTKIPFRRTWTEWILKAYVLLLAAGILINHPYEYAYYNSFAGHSIENTYELDYWNMSFKQAYEVVLKDSDEENILIGTVSNPSFWGLDAQLYAIRGKKRMRIVLCEDWREAQYLIINPMYANMYGRNDYDWIKRNYHLVDTLISYGNIICEIYKK